MTIKLDIFCTKILSELQVNANLNTIEIGDRVGLSSSAVWRRIKSLKEQGIITHTCYPLSAKKLGLHFEAYVDVRLNLQNESNAKKFEESIEGIQEVLNCWRVSDENNYILQIITLDTNAFDGFLNKTLLSMPFVADVKSRIVVRQCFGSSVLPLKFMDAE